MVILSNDASELIQQQFKDGGVLPGTLTGQDAVSKTSFDAAIAALRTYIDGKRAYSTINGVPATVFGDSFTIAGSTTVDVNTNSSTRTALLQVNNENVKPLAQNVSYSGLVSGTNNAKDAIDSVKTTLNDIVASAGNSNTEIVAARSSAVYNRSFPTLDDRLESSEDRIKSVYYNVLDYGADKTGAADSATSIQNAINACQNAGGGTVFFPKGTYTVLSGVASNNPNVRFQGEEGMLLLANATMDSVITIYGEAMNLQVSGNNKASKCITIGNDYCQLINCKATYATYGYYNTHDVIRVLYCAVENCTYGFYSANRFINSFIYGFIAQNNQYGVYITYSSQQPQAIYIMHSLFFGNSQRGVYVDKDIFVLSISNCVFDGSQQRAIMLNMLSSNVGADIFIKDCFISANEVPIFIGQGYHHIVIDSNRIDNGSYYGLVINASSTLRNESVTITNNSFGNNASGDITIDSVNGCWIEKNTFSSASGTSITNVGSFSGTTPPTSIKNNYFPGPNRVSMFNTLLRDNINFVTNKEGQGAMPNGSTNVTVNHGMNITPTNVLVTPKGNIGSIWVTSITSTSFVVNCSIAPGSATGFTWTAT